MSISIAAGGGLGAVLGNSDLEAAGAAGAAADPGSGAAFQNAQAAAQSSFDPPSQKGVTGKPPINFTLDTSNIQDFVAPRAEQPCTIGPAAMTSNPGQMLQRQLSAKSASDILGQLPADQGGGSTADMAGQLPADQRASLAAAYPSTSPLWNTAFGGADSTEGSNGCAAPDAAKPKPPSNPADLLENDPLVSAKEAELKSSMLTPKENKDGNGSLPLAMSRFELQPTLTSRQQTQFEKVPTARADIAGAAYQKQYETEPDAAMNKLFTKQAQALTLKEGLLVDSGHGDFLQTMKASDDAYGGGQRGFDYQVQMSMAVPLMGKDLPKRGAASLGSPEVHDEVERVMGTQAASELPSMTPLQQATLYSQAAQTDLMRTPLGNAEQLASETPENFTRDYTYLGPDKVQGFSDLKPQDRTLLNREASADQLYRQTGNAGTDWGAAVTEDGYARAAKQLDLNAAQPAKQAAWAKYAIPLPTFVLPPSFTTSAGAAKPVDAATPAGAVPALNGAPAVPDQFKAYVQDKGLDVSHWDAMTNDAKAESVKAAYLFNLAGDALALVPIKP